MAPRKSDAYKPDDLSDLGNVALVAYRLSDMNSKLDRIKDGFERLEEKLDKRVRDMEDRFNALDDRYLKRTDFEPYRSNLLKIAMAIILAVLGAALAFFLKK